MSLEIKDVFLTTQMGTVEYMRIPTKHFPQDIMKKYKLHDKIHNGHIYCRIKKGMYGLKKAVVLAFNHLKEKLVPFGYKPIDHTDGMWKHKTRNIKFCLYVDDFGIKYLKKEDAMHLIHAIHQNYQCTIDWEGRHFCGLTFDW